MPGEQRILDFLGEEPFPFQLVQRAVDFRIAPRFDDHELDLHAVAGEGRLHPLGLPQGEPAPPSPELQRAAHPSPLPPFPSPYYRHCPATRPPTCVASPPIAL